MAIKSNKKIDFEYEFESPNGGSYSISLRFYHTEEYGPTIGVLDDEGEAAINFPVTMFSEVSSFLVDQGILEGNKKVLSVPQIPLKLPKTSLSSAKPSLALPKPKLVSAKPSLVNPLKMGTKPSREVVEVDLENDDGSEDLPDVPDDMKEALLKEKHRLEGIQADVEGMTPVHSLSQASEQPAFSEEEMQQIMAERQAAAAKAKTSQKTIRKKDD